VAMHPRSTVRAEPLSADALNQAGCASESTMTLNVAAGNAQRSI